VAAPLAQRFAAAMGQAEGAVVTGFEWGALRASVGAGLLLYSGGIDANEDAEMDANIALQQRAVAAQQGANSKAGEQDQAIDRQDAYVVRVQAQGTSLKSETSVPIVGRSPIQVDQVQAALAATAGALTPREQRRMASAFADASAWAGRVAAGGGIGPIGSTTFPVPGYKGSQARVDIEILKGHNIVP
jgi:hypothetical protein